MSDGLRVRVINFLDPELPPNSSLPYIATIKDHQGSFEGYLEGPR